MAAFFCGVRYYFFLPLLPHSLNFHCKHSVTGALNPVLGGAYGLVAGGDYQPWERFSFQGLVGHRSDSQTSQASGRVPDNSVRGWGLIAWLRELPAMGAVLRLGASWLQWRHPDIPSTRLSHSVTVAWVGLGWGLMAVLPELPAMGAVLCLGPAGYSGGPQTSQAPIFHTL